MEVYFNEASSTVRLNPTSSHVGAVLSFIQLWRTFSKQTLLKHIRCNEKYKIIEFMNGLCGEKRNSKQELFYSIFVGRYLEEEEQGGDAAILNRVLMNLFYLDRDGQRVLCTDMGFAVLKKSITIGVCADNAWNNCKYNIIETDKTTNIETHHIALCLTEESHLEDQDIVDWIDLNFRSEPVPANLLPRSKTINLSPDHHGGDVLQAFSEKIRTNSYVLKVVNSLAWESRNRQFIENCTADGLIYLRLHWTDRGLGIVVKTTGINIIQTKKIAAMLDASFNKRA